MKISVIIPCYQHSNEIARCLNSIFSQDYDDIEVIVVNDGSTDDTLISLEPFRDRIKLINQENKGGNAARNRGFKESSGELLLFSDADLIWKPYAFRSLVQALKKTPEASYAYSSFKYGWKKFKLWSFSSEKLKERNYIHTSALIRREHFPGFDEKLRRLQDWDLWLTMNEKGYIGVWVDKILFTAITKKHLVPLSGISEWLPSFMYRVPWSKFGFKPKTIERYDRAADIVRKKHGL